MSGQTLTLATGARLVYDGELWEVVEFDGAQVVLCSDRTTQIRAVQIGRLVAGARPADNQLAGEQSPTLVLSGLTDAQPDNPNPGG